MQQDRPAGFLDDLVDRPEVLLVERRAVDVGVELDRIGAVSERALGFLGRRLRRVHGERGGVAGKAVGMPGDELGKLVVADARPLRRGVLVPQAVDRRHGEREDLRIVGE